MNFADVENAIGTFGAQAREGKLAMEDMMNGTFTISNGGVYGSLMGTPIINGTGQSAILGMHGTKVGWAARSSGLVTPPNPYHAPPPPPPQMRAVVNAKGVVVARPMMYLALTYDHRIVDGREAVTFLKSVANKVEDPQRLLLGL
jgi:2-oxoglutarate dehydrogenase E2 component (dihydrolipoamide succinyltransferase)